MYISLFDRLTAPSSFHYFYDETLNTGILSKRKLHFLCKEIGRKDLQHEFPAELLHFAWEETIKKDLNCIISDSMYLCPSLSFNKW